MTEDASRKALPIDYVQLLETNNLIQHIVDESYYLCLTRTVQESKLYPVSAYMLLSYLNCFYRTPELLRKIETRMKAEEIADRARLMGAKMQTLHIAWCLPAFYLLGREMLISFGMIRPQDAVEDVVYVMDFWKRFQLSWHRNNGHLSAAEAHQRTQILPDRTLEVFSSDMFACEPGDELQEAAHAFLAIASQYGFLVSCESRISLANTGPYKIDENHEMIVRDFMDMAECSLPWLDGVAQDVPFNNFTVAMSVRDCHFHLMDDWGSFESTPAFTPDKLAGVGLYVSDPLSDGHQPLGMGSREELIAKFNELSGILKDATNKLWTRMAGWSRDQLMDAGALVYFSIAKDLAHVAGIYEVGDWMEIDPRAERFRTLLNDEFANLFMGELVGHLSLPNQQRSPFTMSYLLDKNVCMMTPIPYSILAGEDYVGSCGPIQPGTSSLDPKVDRYCTTQGTLNLAEYNERAREFVPAEHDPDYRFLCETWVKYNNGTPAADELYKLAQRKSRTLQGRGTGKKH